MIMDDSSIALLTMIIMVMIAWFFFAIIWNLAVARGHSPWPWIFLSLVWSWFGSIILLLLFFRREKPRRRKYRKR